MEIIKHDYYRAVGRVSDLRLHRADIEKFIKLVEGKGKVLKLYDNVYKYSSLDDYVENNGSRIKKLVIEFRNDNDEKSELTSLELNDKSLRLEHLISQHEIGFYYDELKRKKGFFSKVLKYENVFFTFTGAILIFLVISIIIRPNDLDEIQLTPFTIWYTGITGSFIMLYLLVTYFYRNYYLGFFLEREHESTLKKNTKEVLKTAGWILLGGFITKLIDWIF